MNPQDVTQAALRLIALGVGVVILQVSTISQITLFDATADIVPLTVGFVALGLGATPGMLFGFGVGLFLDTALINTLGLSSLVLVAVGYGAGRLSERSEVQGALGPIAVGLAVSALAAFGYALMAFLLGADAPVSFLLLRQLIATVAVSTLLALPVWALTRRVLGEVLPEDLRPRKPSRRRRRASSRSVRGGLSPLQRP